MSYCVWCIHRLLLQKLQISYKYLLNIHVMEKSSKRFWLGLLPIIVGELINILSLICFWVTK